MSSTILKEWISIKNRGSISIISLLVMSMMFISALFLVYLSNMEYFIVNSSLDSIQAYYLSEGKIDMLLRDKKYYEKELLPRIETYIRYGRITPTYSKHVLLDSEDLYKGDSNKIITVNFSTDDRMGMELETYSTFNNIRQDIKAQLTIINDFFELRNPVLSIDSIQEDKIQEFLDYMDYLEGNIRLPEELDGIMELEIRNYNKIRINQLMDGGTIIEYFRNDGEEPIKREGLTRGEIFLLVKDDSSPTLTIDSENDQDRLVLKGIIYLEGDLEINCGLDFSGILILNRACINIEPSKEVDINGIVLLKESDANFIEEDNVKTEYDFNIIRRYGIYLPKFVDPKIQIIKN